jgi:hypothetical protein
MYRVFVADGMGDMLRHVSRVSLTTSSHTCRLIAISVAALRSTNVPCLRNMAKHQFGKADNYIHDRGVWV